MASLRRRRLLLLAAVLPFAARARAERAAPVFVRGLAALGVRVELRIVGVDTDAAEELGAVAAGEILRLERIFSLYRSDSALVELNRSGRLELPPPELLEVLALARLVHAASDGAFDPTVQPLWQALAERARTAPPDAATARALARELGARTGLERVDAGPQALRLPAGGALTLNGIAQGYIADRVVALLQRAGLRAALVDTGELRALGRPPGGEGFPVELAGGGRIALAERALAVSEPHTGSLPFPHILHPREGFPPQEVRRATVVADTAAIADALSTAACLLEPSAALALARRFGAKIRVETGQGRILGDLPA